MSFFWNGYILKDFLFKGFDTNSLTGFIGVCIGLLSAGILYEALHFVEESLAKQFRKLKRTKAELRTRVVARFETRNNENEDLREAGDGNPNNSLLRNDSPDEPVGSSNTYQNRRMLPKERYFNSETFLLFVASILQSCYVFIGFTLMNAVMTFNTWVFISVCGGVGIGYLFFRSPNEDTSENEIDAQSASAQSQNNGSGKETYLKQDSDVKTGPCTSSSINNHEDNINENLENNELSVEPTQSSKVIVVGAQVHHNNQQSM